MRLSESYKDYLSSYLKKAYTFKASCKFLQSVTLKMAEISKTELGNNKNNKVCQETSKFQAFSWCQNHELGSI